MIQLDAWSDVQVEPIIEHVPPVLTPEQLAYFTAFENVPSKPRSQRRNRDPQCVDINLTDEEFNEVWKVIGEMAKFSERHGLRDRYGCTEGLGTATGYFAEFGVHSWTGLPWNAKKEGVQKSDVGGLQVRSTRHHAGHMITHPDNNNDDIYIFVTNSKLFVQKIHGWLYCRETKDYEKYWCNLAKGGQFRPAFGVPIFDLRPLKSLVPILRSEHGCHDLHL